MTGEEHYIEAEKLLSRAANEGDYAHGRLVMRAGVHAQLAIAAVYVKAEAKS